MPYSAGIAFLQISPSFEGVRAAMERQVADLGRQVEKTLVKSLPKGIKEGVRQASEAVGKAGEDAAETYAGAFAERLRRSIRAAQKTLQDADLDAKVDVDLTDLDKKLIRARDRMERMLGRIQLGFDEQAMLKGVDRLARELRGIEVTATKTGDIFNARQAAAELESVLSLADEMDRAGANAGRVYGGAFAEQSRSTIDRALKALPTVRPNVQTEPAFREIAAIRSELETLRGLRIGVDIDRDTLLSRLRYLEGLLDDLAKRTSSIPLKFDIEQARDALHNAFPQEELVKAAERNAGAFANGMKKALDDALGNLRDVELNADTDDLLRDVAVAKSALAALRNVEVGVDMDEDEFLRQVGDIQKTLRRLAEETNSIPLAFDLNQAADSLERFGSSVAGPEGQKAAEEYAGHFDNTIKRRFEATLRNLPEIEVDADTTAAQRELQFLRGRLDALSKLQIGVDISEEDFFRDVALIEAAMRRLSTEAAEVEVRSNSGAAVSELAFVLALAERVDNADPDVNVDVDADNAARGLRAMADEVGISLTRLGYLISVAATLGPVLIPAAAAATAAIATIGSAALAAAAGIGVFALGIAGIGDAVKALDKYAKDADKSAAALSASQARVASAADSVANAERSLASARANAADAQVRAAQRVADAERNVIRVREQVALSAARAARAVEDAQRDVTRSQIDARRAQVELTEAIEDARRSLQDMAFDLESNALSQRQATLDVAEAKRELDKILANPRATQEQREQARITYERQVLQLKELGVQGDRLAKDKAKADKAGVRGSDQVIAAQERLVRAQERVAASQRSLADAIAAQVRQQRDGAADIADAQRDVTDAIRDQARTQRQSADSILSAQASLVSAQRSLQEATVQAGVAGGEAMRNLQQAMDALSPAGQRFARFIFGLKDELKSLRDTAQEGMLPGLQSAIERLLPYLPTFRDFVGRVAEKIGELFDRTAEFLTTSPTWRKFFNFISENAVPTMERWWKIGLNLATALVGIFNALSPFDAPLADGLVGLTERFANWASDLENNPGFQKFMDYVRENAPKVVSFLKEMAIFVERFIVAAAPIGTLVLTGLTKLFETLNKIPTDQLTILIGAIALLAGGLGLVAAVTAIVTTGLAGLIVVGVVALGTALVLLYKKVEPVRKVVDATFRAIAAGVTWLVDHVVKPGWERLVALTKFLNENFWQPLLETAKTIFGIVGGYLRAFYEKVWKPTFDNLVWVFRNVVGPTISWFWSHVVKPVFSVIQVGAKILGAAFQVFFGLLQIGFKIVSAVVVAFWKSAVEPTWRLVRPFFVWLGDIIEKHVAPKFRAGVSILGKILDGLIAAFKTPIRFVVNTVLNDGILRAYNFIAKKFNVKPDDVRIDLPKGFARGGPINGRGRKGVDSELIYAAPGEHMWTAREVDAIGGHGAMYALRQAALDGTLAYARGGAIGGDGIGDWLKRTASTIGDKAGDAFRGITDFLRDPIGSLKKVGEGLLKKMPDAGILSSLLSGLAKKVFTGPIEKIKQAFAFLSSDDNGGPGTPGVGGLGGSAGMMRLLRTAFPGLALLSGYRPGAVTSSGNRSWHAVNRAVDLPPRQDVFDWIFKHYFSGTRELIWLGDKYRNIQNGRLHKYSDALLNAHGVAGMPNAHLHWAYDQGGWLPPGWTTVYNGTGQPEPILTSNQWSMVQEATSLARRGVGGNNYNFTFANTTLDAAKLRALQDRDAALARTGRAR